MHIDWSWVISAVIATIISSLIRSGKGRQMSRRLTALEDEVRVLREKLGVTPYLASSQPPIVTSTAMPVSAGSMPDVEALIRQGQLIPAIKVYREQTGAGLKDAKEAVEAMDRRMKHGM